MTEILTHHDILPTTIESWKQRRAKTRLEDIRELPLRPYSWLYVRPGWALVVEPEKKTDYLASDQLNESVAVIMHDGDAKKYTLAHLNEGNDALQAYIKENVTKGTEVLVVSGTNSSPQYDLEGSIGDNCASIRTIYAETGEADFAVTLNVNNGQVSVVRQIPDNSILRYEGLFA